MRALYVLTLNRCPDAGELNYWVTYLNDPGHQSDSAALRSNVAYMFLASDERLDKDVTAAFRIGFAPGTYVPFWVIQDEKSVMRAFQGPRMMMADALASDTLWNQLVVENGDHAAEAFLTDLYHYGLGREIDPGAMTYFLATPLGQAPSRYVRDVLARFVIFSPEGDARAVTSAYQQFLNRAPDAGGAAFWTQWLHDSGIHADFFVQSQLLGSAEAYAYAQTQPNPPTE